MSPEELAFAAADTSANPAAASRRRLSPWRVGGLILVLAAASAAIVGFRSVTRPHPVAPVQSSFMPYIDVTASPQYAFEDASKSSSSNLVLGFVVASPGSACQPSWGGAYSLDEAASTMDLDRRIALLRQRGGQVAISFGGVANTELAQACTDPAELLAAYRAVVDRYSVQTIDLDVEGASSSPAAAQRRAQALAQLQAEEAKAHRPLHVWLTLPVAPTGLTATGRTVLANTLAGKVDLAGVNGLTMDYNTPLAAGPGLTAANESALTHLAAQLSAAYARAGQRIAAGAVWQRLGATPMIGQNDVAAERFGLADARALLSFAQHNHLRRLSMWSVNRDQACGPNYANVSVVSDSCSGIDQRPAGFTAIFTHFKAGRVPVAAPAAPSAVPSAAARSVIVDDPATSPYPVWNPELPYRAGTKIVWHHSVYEAKWWTQGDTPDAPVAAASDTPWTLIGPVLPGEHPQPTPTMSAGTYPAWSATTVYRAGAHVLYDGVGYVAKWYTQGDVPGIVVSDPGQTPWQLITAD
jgi:chitinase